MIHWIGHRHLTQCVEKGLRPEETDYKPSLLSRLTLLSRVYDKWRDKYLPFLFVYALHLKEEEDGGGGERMSSSGDEHSINQALLTDLIIVRSTAQSALHTYSWSITSSLVESCMLHHVTSSLVESCMLHHVTSSLVESCMLHHVTSSLVVCYIITGGMLHHVTHSLAGISGSRGVFL